MADHNLQNIIRKIDFNFSEIQIASLEKQCQKAMENESYNFAGYTKTIHTQLGKKRVIYNFEKESVENILCHYLKNKLDKAFNIKYASRSKIINLLFNTLSATKDMNDFVIVRADFKSFFDSVKTKYVYEKYILPSKLSREEKNIFENYSSIFKYCYVGLCLSNGMTEIVCRDFDKILKAKLARYGVFFYERYVDDMFIMLNSYIKKEDIVKIINTAIKEAFEDCPVKISKGIGKFAYISKRGFAENQNFNFLGYEFFPYLNNKNNCLFKYGITEKKRKKYSNLIERAYVEYCSDGNVELLRQRVKILSLRVVIARQIIRNSFDWITKGMIANYNELRHYSECIHTDTMCYLENLHYDLLKKHKIKRPYFLPKKHAKETNIYNLQSNLQRNRTLLFEEKIGIPKRVIVKWMRKLDRSYSGYGKGYYQIVMEYLAMIKIK